MNIPLRFDVIFYMSSFLNINVGVCFFVNLRMLLGKMETGNSGVSSGVV